MEEKIKNVSMDITEKDAAKEIDKYRAYLRMYMKIKSAKDGKEGKQA